VFPSRLATSTNIDAPPELTTLVVRALEPHKLRIADTLNWHRTSSAGRDQGVAVMRRYLVVANQTLQRAELRDELRKRIEAEPSSFYLLVPNTTAANYPEPTAAAEALQPSMMWWMTDYSRPTSDEQASEQARQRLDEMLADLDGLGVPVEGDLGGPHPLEAMEKVFSDHEFDEIIMATLPGHVSRWLRADLPHRAERQFGLPVTTIITKR
jgi:hypothetical protein